MSVPSRESSRGGRDTHINKPGSSQAMAVAKLPPGKTELWAIIYNPYGFNNGLAMRAFDDEQKAWSYGRAMGIEPLKITVEQAAALKLVKSA